MKSVLKGLGVAAMLVLPAAAQTAPMAHVAQGDLTGFTDHGADAYLNIPYGAPATGDLRWNAPGKPAAWTGARDATKFGPACIQPNAKPQAPWSIEFFVGGPYSEDCLSLNVWTTAKKGDAKAVALFIPGGGFNQGGGGVPIYNGAGMAKAGVVFVTMNYRLSAAGFFANAELATEHGGSSGNYGLMDVLMALHWIHDNIAAFGGDPAKVTVMGQSAGAAAINALLHSPLAAGLFRGAIIDSGVRANNTVASNAEREKMSDAWVKSTDATTLRQLRTLPVDELVPVANSGFRFGPSIDGQVIPGMDGPVMNVPVLTGWNAGEGAAPPGKLLTTSVSRADFTATADTLFGADAPAILALYPSGDDATAAMHAAGHDATMMSGASWISARGASAPAYYYDFEHVMPGVTAADYGSYHSSELPYVFGTLDILNRPTTDTDRKVAEVMQAYWVNFINTGNPNGGALPQWAAFDPAKNNVMALGAAPHMRPIADAAKAQAFAASNRKYLGN
jgi:para-nitrobenzyl esterase